MKGPVLVVAAHPDDEVLGCGASLSRMAREGVETHIVILGEGITSRQNRRAPERAAEDLSKLHAEVQTAARAVGAASARVLNFPDNRFDTVPLLDIIKAIEKIKRELSPITIYTHHAEDLNVDHRVTFQAVMTASRPIGGEPVRRIYSFEVPSSTEWQVQSQHTVFTPRCFVKVEEQDLAAKITAMEAYSSERRAFPHPRSPEALRALCTWRGASCGVHYAEAFELVRALE